MVLHRSTYRLGGTHRHPLTQVAHSARNFCLVMAFAGAGAVLAQQPATAQAARASYDIPAGALGPALSRFSAESGFTLSFEPALTEGRTTSGLRGSYGKADGFARLLEGSGLEAVPREGGGYTLRKSVSGVSAPAQANTAVARTMDEVRITAQAERPSSVTEGTGSYTAVGPSSTATGLNLTLRETPQSVTVMTRQRMDDFQLHTLTDVLEQTPGVSIDHQGDANNVMIRGSSANLQVDGMRQMISGWATDSHKNYTLDDLVEIDRIEVLKGSSGLINGDGKYGGTINMIRKRPTREFQASVGASVGSWSNRRADVDVGGPLNDAGTLRGRVVAAASQGNGFRDNVKNNGQTLFGTLEADLTPDTLLNVGFTYRRREYQGVGDTSMIQAYSAAGQYIGLKPRSFNVGAPWAAYTQESRTIFGSVEQRLGAGWTARLRFSDEETKIPNYESGSWWTALPQAIDVAWTRDYNNRNRALSADVKGPLELFGRQHELVLGADTMRTSSASNSGSDRLSNLGLDYALGGAAIVRPDLDSFPLDNHSYFSSKRSSLFAAGSFSLHDQVKLIAGLRITDYRSFNDTPYSWYNYDYQQNNVRTPFAGLVVDVHPNVSLYGSYARIFTPQNAQDINGSALDPETGTTQEIGAKGEFFDKRLNVSAAYFVMKTDNTAEDTGDARPDGTSIYRAVSGVVRRGYELEMSGELAPGWQAQGSYVQNDSTLSSASIYPRHQFKLASSYRLGSLAPGLTLGAATRWQSKTSASVLQQPSFWVVDLMARYQINRQLTIGVNVNNLFDKAYFAGLRNVGRLMYTWGAPRSVHLNLRYAF